MAMPMTVENYLNDHQVRYEVCPHPHTATTMHSAAAADVPAHQLAKAVLLQDGAGYLMAILPGDYHVRFSWLREVLGRNVGLATERELGDLFADCEVGAVPPLGDAYGIETIMDDSLVDSSEIYFEAGDHEDLIRMRSRDFLDLQANAMQAPFAAPGR